MFPNVCFSGSSGAPACITLTDQDCVSRLQGHMCTFRGTICYGSLPESQSLLCTVKLNIYFEILRINRSN